MKSSSPLEGPCIAQSFCYIKYEFGTYCGGQGPTGLPKSSACCVNLKIISQDIYIFHNGHQKAAPSTNNGCPLGWHCIPGNYCLIMALTEKRAAGSHKQRKIDMENERKKVY